MTPEQKTDAIQRTREWIQTIVIGLDLCPFARRVFQKDLIRCTVSDAVDAEELRTNLAEELDLLAATDERTIETTLLIHPTALRRFSDFCDFLPVAQSLVRSRRLRGVIQIASFHPDFRFEGTEPTAVENYTNRSPLPMLHLLRESSISAVSDANPEEVERIPDRNIARLRELGLDNLLDKIRHLSRSLDGI